MKPDSELMQLPPQSAAATTTGLEAGLPAATNEEPRPLARIHALLRGRYALTVFLALLLGGGGAAAAYLAWKPRYQSVAQVRVAPLVPRILYHSEQNDVMPMYEGYIGSQMAMMGSERVIDRAMRKPQWRQWNRGMAQEAVMAFKESAAIQRDRGAEVINIRFTDDNPDAAQAGAKAVLDAYMEIFGEEDIKRHELQLSVLETRRTALFGETKALRDRIFKIANQYGTDSLEAPYTYQMTEMQKLETALRQMEADSADQLVKVEHATAVEEPRPAAPHVIALHDRTMERFIAEKESVELEIKELLFYRTEQHPMVIRARSRLKNIEDRIASYQKDYNQSTTAPPAADPTDEAIRRFQVLQARVGQYRDLFVNAKAQTLELGRQHLEINRLRQDVADAQQRLKETEGRIEQLNVESSVSGRITIISPGDRPGLPANAGQRLQLSAVAGVGGASAALALMLMLGAVNRKYRFADEARTGLGRASVLGVVPEIRSRLADPETAHSAAMSVHQVRARLQRDGLGTTRSVLAVTSAMPGEGKTSLACALGLSLAASGARTLLIDFDLCGQGLSDSALDRPLLGDLLIRDAGLAPRQLNKAVRRSAKSNTRIGDALVELGHVSREDVEAAAAKQSKLNRGLVDVLAGHPLEECVVRHTPEALAVLPVGNTDGHDLTTLSSAKMESFFAQLKRQYDVILLDCGPVPASLDASLVIPFADAVLFVVSQGTRENVVRRAFTHLEDLRAEMAGVVFNRATWRDLQSYGSSSRSGQSRRGRPSPATPRGGGPEFAGSFGPLAAAAATYQRRREEPASPLVWVDSDGR
jgi:Mrp family chromosome partitioning ATPase/uncharacterized protein involved in exopolysaccharide biosynthesis